MTMHLMRGLTTLNTRKPKFKMTKAKHAQFQLDWAEHNRGLKRLGLPKISFDEYVDNRRGIVRKKPAQVSNIEILNTHAYRREEPRIPSLMTMGDPNSCAKKESIKYTGTLIKGIATMHKSNAVPVINEQEMQDISRMRRG